MERTCILGLISIFSILFFACSNEEAPSPAISYLALGDSYTIGESVNESERWPNQLADSLNQTGANILTPKIIAKTGWRTDQLKDTVTNGLTLGRNYGLVSLLIGVNNQVQGQQVVDFEVEFAGLLSTAISFAGSNPNKVIVLSIPDYGKTVFGQYLGGDEISHEIDQYNEVIKRNCAIQGVRFFDITPISREVVNDSTLLGGDNFHPSGKMYKQWVALLFDEVNRILASNR